MMKKYDAFRSENLEMWSKVKDIIDSWDPIDLLRYGAPSDEYDTEIYRIVTGIKSLAKPDDLPTLVYETFLQGFGPNILRRTQQQFIDEVKLHFQNVRL